jgi:hypothetical protein
MTISMMTFSITALNIMTLRIMGMGFIKTLSMNETQNAHLRIMKFSITRVNIITLNVMTCRKIVLVETLRIMTLSMT